MSEIPELPHPRQSSKTHAKTEATSSMSEQSTSMSEQTKINRTQQISPSTITITSLINLQ